MGYFTLSRKRWRRTQARTHSFRQEYCPGTILGLRLAIHLRQIPGGTLVIEKGIRNLPGLENRLREKRAGIIGLFLLECVVTAKADDQEQRQFHIVDAVSQ